MCSLFFSALYLVEKKRELGSGILMPSKWYIVHVNTGFEERVRTQIENGINSIGNENVSIEEVFIPTETVVETQKGGRKRTSVRKFFPGYVMIKMDLNKETLDFVREIPKVISFVGGRPVDGKIKIDSIPEVPKEKVEEIKTRAKEGTLKPKPSVAFEKGESVRVVEGPFANFSGVIKDVKPEKAKVQVMVSIFGRTTPIELDFNQVEKI